MDSSLTYINILIIQGVSEKIAQSYTPQLCNHMSQSHAIFSKLLRKQNCFHDKGQCLNTTIKYSLFCSWQVNYLQTKLTAKSLR